MAFHKKEFYPLQAQILSAQAIGINYPSRSKILIDLLHGPMTSYELADNQIISRQTLREHLNKLVQLGFVKVEKHQKNPTYSIQRSAIPQWLYLALLDHPDVEIKTILPHISIPFLSNTMAKVAQMHQLIHPMSRQEYI